MTMGFRRERRGRKEVRAMATFKITVVYLVDGVDRPTVLTEQLAKISTDDLEYIGVAEQPAAKKPSTWKPWMKTAGQQLTGKK